MGPRVMLMPLDNQSSESMRKFDSQYNWRIASNGEFSSGLTLSLLGHVQQCIPKRGWKLRQGWLTLGSVC